MLVYFKFCKGASLDEQGVHDEGIDDKFKQNHIVMWS